MTEFINALFRLVCAQNPTHTWSPAGILLPLCQRCTGLYTGAALSFLFFAVFRPMPERWYRWLHVLLVLSMTPFGFHLVPHGAILRTISGQCFGVGMVGLLSLSATRSSGVAGRRAGRTGYFVSCAISVILLPAFARWGGITAAILLPWLSLCGMAAIAGLLATCLSRTCFTVSRSFKQHGMRLDP